MKARHLVPLIVFTALALLFGYVLVKMNKGEYNPREIPTEFIGRKAPAVEIPWLYDRNQRVSSAKYAGKVWLINFWGTWCPECWKEHEFLLHLSRQGVPIFGVDWRDDDQEAIGFLRSKGDPFDQVGVDPRSDLAIEWGVYGAPETFLIDAEGVIREKHAGALTPEVWNTKFAPYFLGREAVP